MTDDNYVELSRKLHVLFGEYGVVGFGGIIMEKDCGAVVSGILDTNDLRMSERCYMLESILKTIAKTSLFTEEDGKITFKT